MNHARHRDELRGHYRLGRKRNLTPALQGALAVCLNNQPQNTEMYP